MFSRLTIPEEAWPCFVLDVDLDDCVNDMRDRGHSLVIPKGARYLAVQALVMGWSWAPFLAHMALVAIMDGEFGSEAAGSRMVYAHPTPQIRTQLRPDGLELLHWAYIDDFGCLTASGGSASGSSPLELIEAWKGRMVKALARAKLP
eukprot:8358289-Heterocapsa_arctica.AAC.1